MEQIEALVQNPNGLAVVVLGFIWLSTTVAFIGILMVGRR